MSVKLTLRMNAVLIKHAKKYARRHGKSVSQIVGDYFLLLTQTTMSQEKPASLPITESLRGILKHTKLSKQDYRHYLEKKYL